MELAIRGALGATRIRIIFQILTESLVLSVIGVAGGIAIAWVGVRVLWRWFEPIVPVWVTPFQIETSVLLFVLLVTLATCLASGLGPALTASRVDLNEILKHDDRTATKANLGRFSRSLVALQVGFSFALLAGAGLMVQTSHRLNSIPLPYDPETVYTARFTMRDPRYQDLATTLAFYREVMARLRPAHGMESVAVTERNSIGGTRTTPIEVEGEPNRFPGDAPVVRYERVSAGYFKALGAPLLKGREFMQTDTAGALPVAIVNTSFVRRYWREGDALGKRFRTTGEGDTWLTVVGVVLDLRMQGMFNFDDEGIGFYRPMSQEIDNTMSILARSNMENLNWNETIRKVAAELAPEEALKGIGTFQEVIDRSLRFPRLLAGLFSIFGIAAVMLAAVGVYGVISFSVNQRNREFGIRIALGAVGADIVGMILRQSWLQLVIGLLTGAVLALLSAMWLKRADLLADIPPGDPVTYLAVLLIVIVVALTAVGFPALRASRTHPMRALRYE